MIAMASSRRYAGQSADQRRSERRDRLIATARSLLGDDGLAGITVTAVCARAELNPRYFYESFADRDALLDAVFNQIATEAAVTIFGAAALTAGEPRQRIRQAYATAIDIFTTQPGIAQTLADLQTDETVMRHRAAWARIIAELAAQNAHILFGDAAYNQPMGTLAVIYGVGGSLDVVTAWLAGTLELTQDEVIDTCTELLLANGEAMLQHLTRGRPSPAAAGQSVRAPAR
jgi:AcrR family transcriptional regulator